MPRTPAIASKNAVRSCPRSVSLGRPGSGALSAGFGAGFGGSFVAVYVFTGALFAAPAGASFTPASSPFIDVPTFGGGAGFGSCSRSAPFFFLLTDSLR